MPAGVDFSLFFSLVCSLCSTYHTCWALDLAQSTRFIPSVKLFDFMSISTFHHCVSALRLAALFILSLFAYCA